VHAPSVGATNVTARVVAGLTAVAAVVLAWQVWNVFVATEQGQLLDQAAFRGADYGQGTLWSFASPVLDVVSVSFVVLGLGTAMGIALLRRRWGLAVQVAFLVVGANVTTQLTKKVVLDRPDLIGGWNGNSLPSGHTTVAGSVSVALLMAVPRGYRPVVALLGGSYTAATGISTLVGKWHRPSDVVAAVLVVLAWGALVLAFTPTSALDELPAGRSGAYPGSVVVSVLLLAGGVTAALGAAWCLREVYPASWGMSDLAETTAYVGGALGVVAATAVSFAVLLLLRQATSRPSRR
jgi:membrane-associated phospholipid phosphatase